MAVVLLGWLFVGWLAALSVFDLRQRRLPNVVTLPGAAVILLVAGLHGRGVAALSGAVALAAVYLLMHLLAPTAMGAGDVKLALGLGAATGAVGVDAWMLSALLAPVLTVCFGLLWRVRVLPHGPSMCLATAVVLTRDWAG